ncbi:MAG: FKBP-type peptidyl-prolyl cis-trans isomerase [Gemmatimonadaceae bacterium]|nr:FKBP-type peptidyl-prolyl cis-trans isomerase [Gemmatimonadaceae bacterium]
MTKKSDNLYIQDLAVGTGAEAIAGRRLTMAYTGWLVDGTQFDSSIGRADFSFPLGSGQVIGGWDQGIAGMRVGGRRRLVIGSALGYGSTGSGAIPPNATLVFTVELKAVQ